MFTGILMGLVIAVVSFFTWEKVRKHKTDNWGSEVFDEVVDIIQNTVLPTIVSIFISVWRLLLLLLSRITRRRAFGILATIFLAMLSWGGYLFVRDELPRLSRTSAKPAPQPVSVPISTPVPQKPKRQIATRVATPEPPPTVAFSIKQTGDQFYRVVIPPGRWVDTGVPAVAGTLICVGDTEDNPRHKFIMRIAGIQQFSVRNVLANQWGAYTGIHMSEDSRFTPYVIVTHEFRDTLKLKVDDEGSNEALTLNIYVDRERFSDPFYHIPGHMALHNESEQWFQMMIAKLARQ